MPSHAEENKRLAAALLKLQPLLKDQRKKLIEQIEKDTASLEEVQDAVAKAQQAGASTAVEESVQRIRGGVLRSTIRDYQKNQQQRRETRETLNQAQPFLPRIISILNRGFPRLLLEIAADLDAAIEISILNRGFPRLLPEPRCR